MSSLGSQVISERTGVSSQLFKASHRKKISSSYPRCVMLPDASCVDLCSSVGFFQWAAERRWRTSKQSIYQDHLADISYSFLIHAVRGFQHISLVRRCRIWLIVISISYLWCNNRFHSKYTIFIQQPNVTNDLCVLIDAQRVNPAKPRFAMQIKASCFLPFKWEWTVEIGARGWKPMRFNLKGIHRVIYKILIGKWDVKHLITSSWGGVLRSTYQILELLNLYIFWIFIILSETEGLRRYKTMKRPKQDHVLLREIITNGRRSSGRHSGPQRTSCKTTKKKPL
jgi:hypothetical protein